jgi:integrase
MTIIDIIKKNRPSLSQSSLRTYNSIIKNLAKQLEITIEDKSDVSKNLTKIMEYLKENKEARKRKTIIASLITLFDRDEAESKSLEKLRSAMLDDIKEAEKDDEKMQMTETQEKNWMDYEEVMKKYKDLEKIAKPLLAKSSLNKDEFRTVNTYVLLSCLLLISPRRSLDYTEMKHKNIDPEKDNYMDGKKSQFVFNRYKTVRNYGTSRVSIPPKLKKIMSDWSKLNDNEYVFLDSRMKPLNQTKLNTILNNFFQKRIGTSMLRHIYLSHTLKNVPVEVFQDAKDMGHTVEQALKYVKHKK